MIQLELDEEKLLINDGDKKVPMYNCTICRSVSLICKP